MTDRLESIRMDPLHADAVEYWHATVMRGGMIASVVVAHEADGSWTARTQLRDRSFKPLGDGWKCGGVVSHAEALHAGQAASLRLHKALVGTHPVQEPPRPIVLEPVGGYQSQALRQFALAQRRVQTTRSATVVPQPAFEVELIA